MQDLYGEYVKERAMMKEIKDHISKWRVILYPYIDNILKMAIINNFIYKSKAISLKIQASCIVDTNK